MNLQDVERESSISVLETELLNVKNLLIDTDYKVIKCAEATALGTALPYDIDELHQQRQEWRDLVNAIGERIERLEEIEESDESIPTDE